jgi:hypothetical protein
VEDGEEVLKPYFVIVLIETNIIALMATSSPSSHQRTSTSTPGELDYYKVFFYTNAKQSQILDKDVLEKFSPKPRDKHIDFWPAASVAYVQIKVPGLEPISKVHVCCQPHWKMKMHPEEQILRFLEALIKAGKDDLTCTVYENNSPCHKVRQHDPTDFSQN